LEDDERDGHLAAGVVRAADDGHLGDGGVSGEDFFDLAGVGLLAADDDEVLQAVG